MLLFRGEIKLLRHGLCHTYVGNKLTLTLLFSRNCLELSSLLLFSESLVLCLPVVHTQVGLSRRLQELVHSVVFSLSGNFLTFQLPFDTGSLVPQET